MSRRASLVLPVVLLGFTSGAVARADGAQVKPDPAWIDNPYQAHRTWGPTVRLGSAVGYTTLDHHEYLAIGGLVGVGHRFGRLTVEAEYGYLSLQEPGPTSITLGVAHRLGVDVKLDVLRLQPSLVGPNSLVAFYVEAALAQQHTRWRGLHEDEPPRDIPPDASTPDVGIGFGVLLDHRLEQPRGIPHRIGWQLGWRLTSAPPRDLPMAVCRGTDCASASSGPARQVRDTALILTSSLAFSW